MKNKIISLFLSRKYILCILILIISSLLVYYKSIGDAIYAEIIIATVGGYIAGNVIQTNIEVKGQGKINNKNEE